ncbi:hypothetical protein D9615_010610 [Tricholomella constricta]|uniref:Uncharacterized protein n=1 Tax=Tricholomella constricta TaxID=117010 RepID=A0A8H5GL54_9AGAR|nr:hypothetical protein D9615_010610 [Tricholomella constricta]
MSSVQCDMNAVGPEEGIEQELVGVSQGESSMSALGRSSRTNAITTTADSTPPHMPDLVSRHINHNQREFPASLRCPKHLKHCPACTRDSHRLASTPTLPLPVPVAAPAPVSTAITTAPATTTSKPLPLAPVSLARRRCMSVLWGCDCDTPSWRIWASNGRESASAESGSADGGTTHTGAHGRADTVVPPPPPGSASAGNSTTTIATTGLRAGEQLCVPIYLAILLLLVISPLTHKNLAVALSQNFVSSRNHCASQAEMLLQW